MSGSEIKISPNPHGGPTLWGSASWNPGGPPSGLGGKVGIETDGRLWLWADPATAKLVARVAAKVEIEQMAKSKLSRPEVTGVRFRIRPLTDPDYESFYDLAVEGELNLLFHLERPIAFFHRGATPVPDIVAELIRAQALL